MHCFAAWVREFVLRHAGNQALASSALLSSGGSIQGLAEFLAAAKIPVQQSAMLVDEVASLGAVDVAELSRADWASLPSWSQLRELERRRIPMQLG